MKSTDPTAVETGSKAAALVPAQQWGFLPLLRLDSSDGSHPRKIASVKQNGSSSELFFDNMAGSLGIV